MKKFLKKVFEISNIQYDAKVGHFIETNGLDSYEAITALKNKSFFEKCLSFYVKRGNPEMNPGEEIKLQLINESVSALTKQEFIEKIENQVSDVKIDIEKKYPLLQALNEQVEKREFSPLLKDFSSLVRLKVGKIGYELLCENLPLPKISSVALYLSDFQHMHESELQVKELVNHLIEHGCSENEWSVFIAEDATAIISKVEYRPDNDQLVGFVSPLNKNSGLPEMNHFPATSVATAKKYFDNHEKAKSVYAICAIPLSDKAPPFILSLFGTSNKFSHNDVLKRFTFIKKALIQSKINLVGFASDADSRLLKAMKIVSELGTNDDDEWNEFFFAKLEPEFIVFQDLFHIISKLRTRLLDTAFPMKIGKFKISLSTLKCLLKDFPELKKFLRPTDLEAEDKMNVDAGKRICHEEVIKYVNDPGLKCLLTMMKDFIQAFEDSNLDLNEKILKTWTFNFVLRGWRRDILNDSNKKMEEFISLPTYFCIELNCHNLISFYILCRDKNQLDIFKHLDKCNSQPCEELFRQFRSMTTLNWTSVNMTMLEVCYKAKRINSTFKLEHKLHDKIKLPRFKKSREQKGEKVQYFNNTQILSFLVLAKRAADAILISMGIQTESDSFMFQQGKTFLKEEPCDSIELIDFEMESVDINECEQNQSEEKDQESSESVSEDLSILKKYCGSYVEQSSVSDVQNKLYFCVKDGNTCYRIRKDAFVRLFNQPDFVSKDRTRRFISKKKTDQVNNYVGTEIVKRTCISTSDYIIIEQFRGVVRVLEFKNINDTIKTKTGGRVKSHSVNITEETNDSVGMLLDYFIIEPCGTLKRVNDFTIIDDFKFIPLSKYKKHVPDPDILEFGILKYSQPHNIIDEIEKCMQEPVKPTLKRKKEQFLSKKSKIIRKKEDSDEDYQIEESFLNNLKNRVRKPRASSSK